MLAIKACYLYIPALLIVASMLWIGRFYRLDDQYEQIRADLDAGRRAPSDVVSRRRKPRPVRRSTPFIPLKK
jgi:Na+/melibiose symporter-like transporter